MARPVSAFKEFPIVNEAYSLARTQMWSLFTNEALPEFGRIVVPTWAYMHSCVPEHFNLPPLRHEANLIESRCKQMVKPLLRSGVLAPDDYAARVRGHVRFAEFVARWISRPLKGRALDKFLALR